MKSKRAPWHTAKTGNSWHQAGSRYLDVATCMHEDVYAETLVKCKLHCSMHAYFIQAQRDDTLQQLFAEAILMETLVGSPSM